MKLALAILSIATLTFGSINPDRTVVPFFEIYGGYTDLGDDLYSVEAPYYFEGEVRRNGNWQEIKKETYHRARELGKHVLTATPRKVRGEWAPSFGTAFHVGGNLVLTAWHVIDKEFRKNSCNRVKTRLSDGLDGNRIGCFKVHHCNRKLDYCLAEMYIQKRGLSLQDLEPPIINAEPQRYSEEAEIMAIGNTSGLGLHASVGKGIKKINDKYWFYAPVFFGNSGGPIFNENDEIVGIVTAQSKEFYGDRARNYATSMADIKLDLEKNLGTDHPAYKAINFK